MGLGELGCPSDGQADMAVCIIGALVGSQRHLSPKRLLRRRVGSIYHSTGRETEAQRVGGATESLSVSKEGLSSEVPAWLCAHSGLSLLICKMGVPSVICYITDFKKTKSKAVYVV